MRVNAVLCLLFCKLLILLAKSPAGAAGPQAPENIFFGAPFCQRSWQKGAPKALFLEGLALQTSQLGVSQQNDCFACRALWLAWVLSFAGPGEKRHTNKEK
jgi:hypothetical protein